jgi:DNA invertase Pin-like site-specific DNA recombinase
MDVVAYIRVSSKTQDYTRQKTNLQNIADERGWNLVRVFSEKVSGTIKTDDRKEFKSMITYLKEKSISLCMVSEISRVGRRVLDVLNSIDLLHQNGISLYVQQFNMSSLENGKENPMVKMLIQMLAMGSEMENNMRKERQLQGIQLAKMKGKYQGRVSGSTASKEKLMVKYKDVVDLVKSSDLSLRRIASITKRSINTVAKVRDLV